MKTKCHRLCQSLLFTALLVPLGVAAQSAVPEFISYQGRVSDASGLVGAGTPVNRTVTFRIWNHPTNVLATNLIYSEEQTVTISDGKFSVLVGQGVPTTSSLFGFDETPFGQPTKTIADAFGDSERYIGITVDDGNGGTVDNEVTPRQQVVTSAFSFRSKVAETLGTSTGTALIVGDTGKIGVGTDTPTSLFTITGPNTTSSTSTPQLLITDSADTNESLRIGVDSTGNGSGFIQSFKTGTAAQNLLLNPQGGNVGIGNTNPEAKLDVKGDSSPQLMIRGASNPSRQLQIGYRADSLNAGLIQAVDLGSGFTNLLLNTLGGNVGIGTSNGVIGKLTLGNAKADGAQTVADGVAFVSSNGFTHAGMWAVGASAFNGNLVFGTDGDSINNTNVTEKMRITAAGNVGIGTASPSAKLDVNGGVRASGVSGYRFNSGGTESGMSSVNPGTLGLLTNGVERIFINSAGLVGIGTFSPGVPLEVHNNNGYQALRLRATSARFWDFSINQSTTANLELGFAGVVKGVFSSSSGAYSAVSDRRLKTKIQALEPVLDKVMGLEPSGYWFKADVDAPLRSLGFIAQDVEEIFPEAVHSLSPDTKGIEYTAMVPIAFKAIQELKDRQDSMSRNLEAENAELKKRLAELEAKDKARDAKLAAIEAMLSGGKADALPVSLKKVAAAAVAE